MLIELIEKRIAQINESINQTNQNVQLFTQNLQASTQQLQTLQGHLNECMHWKQTMDKQQPKLPDNPEPSAEQSDGDLKSDNEKQAA